MTTYYTLILNVHTYIQSVAICHHDPHEVLLNTPTTRQSTFQLYKTDVLAVLTTTHRTKLDHSLHGCFHTH